MLRGDGPTGPGGRDWATPHKDLVSQQTFANGGNGPSGINAVLDAMVDSLGMLGNASTWAKIAACDARHNDAMGFVVDNPDWPLMDPTFPGLEIQSWNWQQWNGYPTSQLTDAFSGVPFSGKTLTPDQVAASNFVVCSRQSGDGTVCSTNLFYPTFKAAAPSGPRKVDPKRNGWEYLQYAGPGSGNSGIDEVLQQLKGLLDNMGPSSIACKYTADDRRHGDARGYAFINPTLTGADLEFVVRMKGWARYTIHFDQAWKPDAGDAMAAILNTGQVPGLEQVLTWAQICTSRVLFTDRQSGGYDGATLSLIYPLI